MRRCLRRFLAVFLAGSSLLWGPKKSFCLQGPETAVGGPAQISEM